MTKAEQNLNELIATTREKELHNPFLDLLPAMGRVYYLTYRLERDIAILRCVEAIRIYAAGHNGQLPKTLSDIKEVPVPLDPLWGKDFVYKLVDNKAIIESMAPPEQSEDNVCYELIIKK